MVAIAPTTIVEKWRRLGAVAALAAVNVADVWTTDRALAAGGQELNPMAGWLLARGTLLPAKLALVALVALLVAMIPLGRRWVGTAVGTVAVVYASVVAFNGAQLVLRAHG